MYIYIYIATDVLSSGERMQQFGARAIHIPYEHLLSIGKARGYE